MQEIMDISEQYLLPVSLWLIMMTMGMALVPADFRRIVDNRRAFVLGVGSMLFLVSGVGTLLAVLFAPSQALTVGLILLATCPGGILSNLLTDIAKGDVALSISMSLFLSVIYVFTLPFIADAALRFAYGEGSAIAIPISSSLTHIMAITLLPVIVGMLARAYLPGFTAAGSPKIKSVSTVVLCIVFGLITYDQFDTLRGSFGIIMAIVVAMNVTNAGLALLVSKLGRVTVRERTAITVEHLIRQEGTAIYVAVTLLHRNDMSIPMIINTFIGMAVCSVFVTTVRRLNAAHAATTVRV